MKDLLLEPSTAASPVAGTVPFSLLSAEGVRAYRRALFRKEVIDNCASSPFPGTLILRDAAKRSDFIKDFWTHPKTMAIVSEAVGVPLEVVMPTEIGHTNIQVQGTTISDMASNLKTEPSVEKLALSSEDQAYDPLKDTSSIIPWQYVEGPQLGYAVMLQGGEVCHLAARAKGVKERISTITSYRSMVPGIYDSSYITNVRPYADTKSLYPGWERYRLQKLRDEITHFLEETSNEDGPAREKTDIHTLVNQQIEYLKRTSRQTVDPEYTKQIVEKYGKPAYYDSPKIWKVVQSAPDFEIIASRADSKRQWMPGSPYWMDLQGSIETIRLGSPLQSALGTAVLDKTRAWFMGDELLRQGLNEMFLDWLGNSGLWEVYCNMAG
ncbi:unnamed protein product [Penicillium olsonii]|nr:unnamed protein product [Penicillium olsonii]